MNKRKFFNAMAAGVLMTTSLAPVMTVSAATINNINEAEKNELINIYDDETANSKTIEVLNNLSIEKKESIFSVKGVIPDGYSLEFVSEHSDQEPNSSFKGKIDLEFDRNEIIETDLLYIMDENKIVYEIDLSFLLDLLDKEMNSSGDVDDIEDKSNDLDEEEDIFEESLIKEDLEPNLEGESETGEDTETETTVTVEEPVKDNTNTETTETPKLETKDDLHPVEPIHEPAAFSMSRMQVTAGRVSNNGIYTVVSGDTFNDIAKSFNISSKQLEVWNYHVTNRNNLQVGTKLAVNRTGVQRMLSAADQARLYKGGASSEFTTRQGFIDAIAPSAIAIANQSGQAFLWPSIMIAQAAHESNYGKSALGSAPYYNLMGIKGSYQGTSTLMWTWEVYSDVRVNVLAGFRDYPSYTESLQDYANLMRNGVSWNKNIYSGTWRSNSSSAWDVLNNGGLSAYATDPNYFAALRNMINTYDLTKYDKGNYYVRTGTFLGENFTRLQLDSIKKDHNNYMYKIVREDNKTPYSYRRVETTEEFLGESGAQRIIDKLKKDKGWSASMVRTGNSTKRNRVWSGWFNSLTEAQEAANKFAKASNYAVLIDKGNDGKYRIRTGFFNSQSSAQSGLQAMRKLGWSAKVIESKDSTPHYKVRTGTFNTPNHVNSANVFFKANGWGSKEVLDERNNYYYRIFIEGFHNEASANSVVSHLSNKYNYFSKTFEVSQ